MTQSNARTGKTAPARSPPTASCPASKTTITKTDAVDVRNLPDQSLIHMRASYRSETGCAPPHVSKQLRDVRRGAETMRLKAIRAEAEAQTAKDQAVAARHADLATKARALGAQHREHEATLNEVMQDRRLWDKLTEGSRQLAVQAHLEFRRRHPDRKIRPLESAEPKAPEESLPEPGWLAELNEQRRVFREELDEGVLEAAHQRHAEPEGV